MSKLWYDKPATYWEEALPIGNGRMGAMVFGRVETEHVQLNEDSVWYGGPIDRNNPDAFTHLSKIRELILKGQIPEAEELMIYALSGIPQSQRPYQTLGDLTISFKGMEGITTDYIRCLSLDDALHTMKVKVGDTVYKRETFLSAADDVMVMRMTSGEDAKLSFKALLTRERFYDSVIKVAKDSIMLNGTLGKGGLDFAIQLKVAAEGGTCEVIGEHLIVRNADAVTLLLTGGTTFRFRNLKQQLNRIVADAVSKSYEELKRRHIEDYKRLYDRVTFEYKYPDELLAG